LHEQTRAIDADLPPLQSKQQQQQQQQPQQFDEAELATVTTRLLDVLLRYCTLFGVLGAIPTAEEVGCLFFFCCCCCCRVYFNVCLKHRVKRC
jgi:hypothetical protein